MDGQHCARSCHSNQARGESHQPALYVVPIDVYVKRPSSQRVARKQEREVQWASNRDISIALRRAAANVENPAGNSGFFNEALQRQNMHGHAAMRRRERPDQKNLQDAFLCQLLFDRSIIPS
jgi:hypothetical protein